MSGMDMGSSNSTSSAASGMDMGGSCKISMLWNWYTTDTCFLTPGWKIRNIGDYVGTLIGIFFMVVALEAIRRLSREYDRRIRKAYIHRETLALQVFAQNMNKGQPSEPAPFRPSNKEHTVRTVLYGMSFGLAYILMLLAMYFNGGIILAIMAGGAAGYGIFGRDTGAMEGRPEEHFKGECCC
ncbi:putative Glutamate synthase (ferredoxin) [Rhodotorula taiwanensis]|uniref:Copper transport protein n=1 Tax=Rhodotorula taiwanensis TaxID=741276 RepID=A0A2S5BII0_9BASI|nr:putative Glutamate synthase (ferredoxin) [Rhodotorula taiwanensis]